MKNRLRIAASVFFAVLTVALCVLWVRSYWYVDYFSHCEPSYIRASERRKELESLRGHLVFASYNQEMIMSNDPGFYFDTMPAVDHHEWNEIPPGKYPNRSFLFDRDARSGYLRVKIPVWFLVAVVSILAAVPWLPWRFSLRTLLIATTLVAVLLGLVCYTVR